MATPEKDIERVQKNLDYVQEELLKRMNAFFGDANLGKNTDDLVRQLKEWKLNIQKENSELKKRQKLVELATKEEQDRLNNLKKINQEAKKPTGFAGFLDRIGYKEPTGDDLALQRRARSRIEGISNLVSGNFGAAFRDLTSSIPKLANLVRTGWFAALQLGVQALLKFDQALAKSTKNMTSVSGGLSSDYVGNRLRAFNVSFGLKESLREIGQQGNFDEIMKSISSNYGQAYSKANINDLVKTSGYARYGLGSFGISEQSSQNLISNLQLIEGKTTTGVAAQLKRLTDRFATMSMFSPEQALQQATSLYDQTKHLGTNFEWASRAIQKFEVGLKNGTISLNDFAAVNRALRGGGISKNAGIAAMVTDYAARSGINLPSEFINSDVMGQGFAISTKAMLKDSRFARAYQGTIQEKLDQMGGATRTDKAARLQYLLSQVGVNIGPEMAESAIKPNGKIDLIGSNIIGTGAFKKEEDERKEAEEYNKMVKDYYKGTESYQKQMLVWMGGLYSNLVTKGFSGGIENGANSIRGWWDLTTTFGALFNSQTWKDIGDVGLVIKNLTNSGGANK